MSDNPFVDLYRRSQARSDYYLAHKSKLMSAIGWHLSGGNAQELHIALMEVEADDNAEIDAINARHPELRIGKIVHIRKQENVA